MKLDFVPPLDRKTTDLVLAIYRHERTAGASRENALEQACHFLAASRQEVALPDVYRLTERTVADFEPWPLAIDLSQTSQGR